MSLKNKALGKPPLFFLTILDMFVKFQSCDLNARMSGVWLKFGLPP